MERAGFWALPRGGGVPIAPRVIRWSGLSMVWVGICDPVLVLMVHILPGGPDLNLTG